METEAGGGVVVMWVPIQHDVWTTQENWSPGRFRSVSTVFQTAVASR